MFEDLLCQMKDISFTDGCIKLSLKTCIPAMGGSICQFGIKCITETSTVEHGLIIKVMTETMALQAAEVFCFSWHTRILLMYYLVINDGKCSCNLFMKK